MRGLPGPVEALLRRAARRCEVHDRPSYPAISALEEELQVEPSACPPDFVHAWTNPALIECGHRWCRSR
ncbi:MULTISPECIES: hypothetical protein [Streptomyces]|uniref:Uncharacterized protein n=1 Tax=Streptomyces doudnae TaxID=3075536 RepID=A0ABD5ELY1_9ACTN|nr:MULTISPECIES: hypothetical protein [unclassified Streptomyces]MDT0435628.1 hypothetical protein [Streptomyces sp. DSM 41981]MYQ62582.1 hypothetical protein [Streptomyces sp. SID4950]SCD40305.1 hypothetical protein GA0115242_104887 [Streptomyces sp. SolWspMP-5a-2]